jgi:glycine/D-amino acid oxidase-like deaminating enzyme
MRAKTVILGGGVMGAAIAWKLAKRADPLEEPVVLIERKDLGAGSSGRSGAILRQHYADPRLALMARDSLREYAAFEGLTGRPIGFQRSGVLSIAGPGRPEWIERLRDTHVKLARVGIDIQLVGEERMRALVPGMRIAPGSIGLWEPDGGFVDPQLTVEAFAALARSYGAVTRLGLPAHEIRIEQGRVRGVEAGAESFAAEQVIVCTGPWTKRLLAAHGFDLPLCVVRPENHFLSLPPAYRSSGDDGQDADLEDPLEALSEEIAGHRVPAATRVHPVLLDMEGMFYARCEPSRSRTRVGRADYTDDQEIEDPDALEETVGPAAKAWSRAVLSERVPAYASEPDAGSLAAWYTLTPDAQALIGPLEACRGLYVATGFSGHGFKLAPSVAEGLAQRIHGEPVTAFDEALFAPGRFAAGSAAGGAFGL